MIFFCSSNNNKINNILSPSPYSTHSFTYVLYLTKTNIVYSYIERLRGLLVLIASHTLISQNSLSLFLFFIFKVFSRDLFSFLLQLVIIATRVDTIIILLN